MIWVGICQGHALIAMSPFCLLRVKTVPSEEDSASCAELAGLIQSLIAVSNVNYALSSNLPLRQPFKTFQNEIVLKFGHSGRDQGIISKIME